MSKSIGQKIGIRFTEDIVNLTETPVGGHQDIETQEGTWTASGTYSGYSVESLKDGDVSTMWQTRSTGSYIQIELDSPKVLTGLKYYRTTSYYSMGYTMKGSQDGIVFEDVYKGSTPYGSGYVTTTFDTRTPYKYYRLVIDSLSNRLYLYELILLYKPYKNEIALGVSGLEHQYVNGPLHNRKYGIERVEKYPGDSKALLLTLEVYENRFNNVEGNLTITYDASLGDLMGRGGGVESFEVFFSPTDLLPKPNPHKAENLTAQATGSITLIEVFYTQTYNLENITLQAEASIDFIDVSIINP